MKELVYNDSLKTETEDSVLIAQKIKAVNCPLECSGNGTCLNGMPSSGKAFYISNNDHSVKIKSSSKGKPMIMEGLNYDWFHAILNTCNPPKNWLLLRK